MEFGEVVVTVVGMIMTAGTLIACYAIRAIHLPPRGRVDMDVLKAVEELRGEIAALRQHETEAVLSFDSTLQTLDARVQHLERAALEAGSPERVLPNQLFSAGGQAPVAGDRLIRR